MPRGTAQRREIVELERQLRRGRAQRPFPVGPVRTLDALHLASALVARSVAPGLRLLTLDQRIRENGARLGLAPLP
jgi:hypothetical protein